MTGGGWRALRFDTPRRPPHSAASPHQCASVRCRCVLNDLRFCAADLSIADVLAF